jgi:hypothetical protein
MIFPLAGLDFSPLRIALVVAAMVYLDGLWLHRHAYFAFGASLCLAAAGMGPTVPSINDNALHMARSSSDSLNRLVPKTLRQWGMVSIGASFVLLLLGAVVSLTRRVIPIATADESSGGDEPSV